MALLNPKRCTCLGAGSLGAADVLAGEVGSREGGDPKP